MKNIIIVTLALFLGTLANAQKKELGKVTIEELQQKQHPLDSTAVAAYLFKRGKTYFDTSSGYFILVTEVEQRIKIYKKEGYDFANEEIPYYVGGVSNVVVYFDDAVTYNLENGVIVKTKLKSDSEFKEEINRDYRSKKIVMPNVKEGSVIEYKYVIKTPYFSSFPDWYFQYSIPADYVEYKIAIAEFFNYNRLQRGSLKINQSPPESSISPRGRFGEVRVTYSANNIAAIKDEPYVANMKNYTSILEHELSETQLPGSPKKKYSSDWESVAKSIYDHDDFGKELNTQNYFETDLDALLKGVLSEEDKINVVFNFVKERMNWDKYVGYYCDKGVKSAYKNKIGNVAEINLMLTAMLRYAELKANPVLLSTRNNGIASYPNRNGYNYVIAAVESQGKIILLDATSKFSEPDILPFRTLNWTGRMVKKDRTTKSVDIMPKIISREMSNIIADIDSQGNIKGKARDQYLDYNALLFRDKYAGLSKESRIELIESEYKGIQIEDFTIQNEKDVNEPAIETYSFTHDGISEIIGNKIYFSPMLFFTKKENPFKEEKRQYPLDFGFPFQNKYMISITIPSGYVVESIPQPLNIKMIENIGGFSYNISANGNRIQLAATFDLNIANISADYYETIKSFFKSVIDKQNEKIVLKKV